MDGGGLEGEIDERSLLGWFGDVGDIDERGRNFGADASQPIEVGEQKVEHLSPERVARPEDHHARAALNERSQLGLTFKYLHIPRDRQPLPLADSL